MKTVLEIEKEILDFKNQGEKFLSSEDFSNQLLDSILEITKNINKINQCYLELFPLIDELSALKVSSDEDFNALKEIILELSQFTTKTSILFSSMSKNKLIKSGCKSALYDLRANIRSLREYLEDLEETFLLEEDETDIESAISELL